MRIFMLAAILPLAILLNACISFRRPQYVVPEQETAMAQYVYAKVKQQSTIPPANAFARRVYHHKQKVWYQKVVDRFPDDMVYTPRAILEIAEILFKERRYPEAIEYLQEAMPLYPQMPEFQAQSLYLIGWSYDQMGEHTEAKEVYEQCIDTYGQSPNPIIQSAVTRCRRFYNRTYLEF